MNPSALIASRLRKGDGLSVGAVALSFLVMIIAMSVSGGFRREIRSSLSDLCGDIQVTPREADYMSSESSLDLSGPLKGKWRGWTDSLEWVAGVDEVIYRGGIVRKDSDIHGVIFKGGTGNGLDSLRVSIPRRLSEILSLGEGDEMLSYFVGERVRLRKFKVESIYDGIVTGDGNLIVHCGLEDLRRVCQWSGDEVSALEVHLHPSFADEEHSSRVGDMITTHLSFNCPEDESVPLVTTSYYRYPQIFSWLDLIDFNVVAILLLMMVVAGFNMVSGLLIKLLRNIPTIGTLKSLGMTDGKISEIFLRASSYTVLRGMLIGNGLALLFCLVQGRTHLLKLDPKNYFISFVPVDVDWVAVFGVDVVCFVLIMLILLVPCIFISKVDPAKTVRAQ